MVLEGSQGGGRFLMSEVPLYATAQLAPPVNCWMILCTAPSLTCRTRHHPAFSHSMGRSKGNGSNSHPKAGLSWPSLPIHRTPHAVVRESAVKQMWLVRQSRPDHGLGFQVKVVEPIPSSLGSGRLQHTLQHTIRALELVRGLKYDQKVPPTPRTITVRIPGRIHAACVHHAV